MARIQYALDGPIFDSGGPEHARQALKGESIPPANYHYASDDGTKIVYHVCGSGPVLILAPCPGWGPGMNYLPTLLHPITATGKVTLVAIQTRGTLPSAHPTDELLMGSKQMAADIDALRHHLGQREPITVLGHSNGAAIALAYAELFASHCAKAILIETQVIGFEGKGSIMDELAKRENDPRYHDAVKAFKEGMTKDRTTDQEATEWLKSILPLYFVNPGSGVPAFISNTGPLTIQVWPGDQQGRADSLPDANVVLGLDKITAQVLLISGREDFICRPESSRFVQETLGAKARHIIYPDCGHMPWIESKDEFYKDLLAFLLE